MARVQILKRYGFTQSDAASVWVIQHDLDISHPVVDIWITSAGVTTSVNSDAYSVTVNDSNKITVSFTSANKVTGTALVS